MIEKGRHCSHCSYLDLNLTWKFLEAPLRSSVDSRVKYRHLPSAHTLPSDTSLRQSTRPSSERFVRWSLGMRMSSYLKFIDLRVHELASLSNHSPKSVRLSIIPASVHVARASQSVILPEISIPLIPCIHEMTPQYDIERETLLYTLKVERIQTPTFSPGRLARSSGNIAG